MISIHKSEFIKLCKKNGKTLEDCLGCIVSKKSVIWDIDDTHESFPSKKVTPIEEPEEVELKEEKNLLSYKFFNRP